MYLNHFGLRTDPFPLYPSLKFVYASTAFEEAMAHMAYGLEQNEDIVLITGPIGTGKTLAVQNLLTKVDKLYRTALINVTQVDFPELLKLILSDLGAPVAGRVDRADLVAALKAQVRQAQAAGGRLLVVIDEAQNLSPETLEGVRLLTNLGQADGPALQLILSGQPDLERKVNLPQLAQLRQRIRVHYRLETLTRKELDAYVAHRLRVAGCDRQVFRPKALDLIFAASAGVPRLVNILAGRALLAAFVGGKGGVEAEHVDLQDLPPAVGVMPVAPAATGPATMAPPPPSPAEASRPAPVAAPASPAPPAEATERPPASASAVGPAPPAPRIGPASPGLGRSIRGPQLVLALIAVLIVAAAVAVFVVRPRLHGGAAGLSARRASSLNGPKAAVAGPAARVPAAPPPGAAVVDARGAAGSAAGAPALAPSDTLAKAPRSTPPGAAAPAQPHPVSSGSAPTMPAGPPGSPTTRFGSSGEGGTPARPGGALAQTGASTAQGGAAAAAGAPTPTGAAQAPAPEAVEYAIHIHSFRVHDRTESDLSELRARGYPCFYRLHDIDGVTWERVYVGPYKSLDEAQLVARKLQAQGQYPYSLVVKIANEAP